MHALRSCWSVRASAAGKTEVRGNAAQCYSRAPRAWRGMSRAVPGGMEMIKRREFLGTALSASTMGSPRARAAGAAPSKALAPLEPLVWPVVAKPPSGVPAFAGHTDTVLDVVGRWGRPPGLVIFTEGNH